MRPAPARRHVGLAALAVAGALASGSTASASPDPGCSTGGTSLFYGNGIMTDYDRAWEIADDDLLVLATEANVTDVVEIGVAYNHTDGLMLDVIETLRQKQAEDSRFGWFLLNNITAYTLRGLDAARILKLPPGAGAFIAALQTVVNAGITDSNRQAGTFYDADVADQVSGYDQALRVNGHRVIVVAHSQGNLYANASRAALAGIDSPLLGSFGIVAVADPAEFSFNGYVTSDSDVIINALRTLGRTVLPANVRVPVSGSDFLGHGFEDIYINAQLPARAAVVALLSRVSAEVADPPVAGGACVQCRFDDSGGRTALLTGAVAPGESQTYTIQMSAGEGLTARVVDVGAGPFVPRVTVNEPAGAVLLRGSGADVGAVSVTVGKTGAYTVVVSDAANSSPGASPYNLYYAVAPGANACGSLIPGGVVSGRLEEGALDSYSFTAAAGQGVALRVTDVDGGNLVPTFALYDPDGALLQRGTGNDVAGNTLTTAKTGMYTVIVYDNSGGLASTGPYRLYFTLAPGANTGGALTPGGVVSGQIDEGELDSYTFAAAAGQGVALRVTDVGGGRLVPAFNVYDPDGALLVRVSGNDVAGVTLATAKTGTYTVVVYDNSAGSASTGSYRLYFTLAPGANAGGLLMPGDVVSGQIDKGELDSYTFAAVAGERLTLTLTDVGGGTLIPTFAVYDPGGAMLIRASGTDVATTTVTAQKTGTYTIVAYDNSGGLASTGPYTLSLAAAP